MAAAAGQARIHHISRGKTSLQVQFQNLAFDTGNVQIRQSASQEFCPQPGPVGGLSTWAQESCTSDYVSLVLTAAEN
jgi:hypothetical protein